MIDRQLNLVGLKCPMPIVQLARTMKTLDVSAIVSVLADDPAFNLDVQAWCRRTKNELVELCERDDCTEAVIQKTAK